MVSFTFDALAQLAGRRIYWVVFILAIAVGDVVGAETTDSRATAPAASSATRAPSTADALPAAPAGKKWKMIWNDEFDENAIDPAKWTYRPDGKRKEGWWSSKAVSLDGHGHLALRATKVGDKCVCGDIITAKRFEHAFGYYVCRMQFQKQPGHWPAFWLTNKDVMRVGDGGRDGTEIDIFEKPRLGDQIEHNLHWDGYEKDHKCANHKEVIPGLSSGWHTSALWWTPTEYIFYIDGKETWRTSAGGVSQSPEYILLSDEVSKWAGDISKATLPDVCLVDYIRVYDLTDAP
jgi:beta-glucanase (GH16 family)